MITPWRKLQCHYHFSTKKTVKFLLFMIIIKRMSAEVTFCPLTNNCCFAAFIRNSKQNGCCKHILMVEKGGFWVIGILLHCDQPNVFWREFSQACEYYLLARGISSENLLFQQLLKKLPCLQGHQLSKPTVRFYVFLKCLLRQIIEELRI